MSKLEEIKKRAYGTSKEEESTEEEEKESSQSVLERIKNRAKGNSKENDSTNNNNSTSEKANNSAQSVLDRIKSRVDGTYDGGISLPTVNSWFKGVEETSKGLSEYYKANEGKWVSDYGADFTNGITDLRKNADAVGQYLRSHKNEFNDYDSLYKGYSDYLSYLDEAEKQIASIRDDYSRFASEEEYSEHLKAMEQYYNSLDFDLVEGKEEIDRLQGYLDAWEDAVSQIPALEISVARKEHDLKYGWLTPYEKDKLTNELAEEKSRLESYKGIVEQIDGAKLSKDLPDKKDYYALAEKNQKMESYYSLMQASDFAQNSQYNSTRYGDAKFNAFNNLVDEGFYDINYDYINGDPYARSVKDREAVETGAAFAGVSNSERIEMTPEEVSIFNYIYRTDSPESAYAYVDFLESDLNARQRAAEQARWAEYAKANPIESSVFSVITAPLKGASYLGQTADYLEDGKIDENAGYNKFSYINSSIRNQVTSAVENNWGKVGSFAYQTGMSMADFLFNTAVSGGNSAFSLAIMGTGAAADTVISAKDRGLSDNQAFALGTIAGAAEIITEKISLDTLLDAAQLGKSALGYVVKNVVAEGSEEVGSSLINLFADVVISKDKSEWQTAINAYKAKNMSDAEAFWHAVGDQALSLGLDFLGGAISGGVMGGGAVGINAAANAIAENKAIMNHGQAIIDKGGVDPLRELAYKVAEDNQNHEKKRIERLTGRVASKATAKNVGRLSSALEGSIIKQNRAAFEAKLMANGLSKKEAALASDYLTDSRELTPTEISTVENDRRFQSAIDAVSVDPKLNVSNGIAELYAARTGKNLGEVLNPETNGDIINKESEVLSDEGTEGIHLRDGGERFGGADPEGSVPGVEGSSGPYQIRREAAVVADSEAARFADEGREVSVASLGILRGSKAHTVRLVDEASETPLMKEARAKASKRGLNIKFFAGNNLVIADAYGELFEARGYILGNTMLVRADHPYYTAEQIARHEMGHDMIAKGEVDADEVRKRLLDVAGKESVDFVAEAYAAAYEGTRLTPEEIWEECICDSLGDMNVFSSRAEGEAMAKLLPAVKEAAESTAKSPVQTRGSPEGKASRETFSNDKNKANTESGGHYGEKGSQNSELLERGEISAAYRSEDDIWKHSKNTRMLKSLLGLTDEQLRNNNIKAGDTGWLESYQGSNGFGEPDDKQKARRFLQGVHRKLSRTKLKNVDTVGRKLSSYVLENFSETVFKTEDGRILSLWHWTNKKFSQFRYGDIGFHAGTFDASYAIMFDKSQKGETGIFKELYFNSKNPLFIDRDLTKWTPYLVAVVSNVLSESEIAEIYSLDGATRQQYDSEAAIRVREMLKAKGYDSIIYTNDWEGGLSVIAFDAEQFYTVAENGVDVEGHASRELDAIDAMDELAEREGRGRVGVEPLSDREILAGALEGAAQNDVERKKLAEYRASIDRMNAESAKLAELKKEIKELTFGKGKKDPERLKALKSEATKTENRINVYDKKLLGLETASVLKDVLEREKKKAYSRAAQKGREAMHRNVEGRRKTEMRHKIKDIVSELNTLLLKPTAKKHIKEELRKEVADALSAINMDTIGAEERLAEIKKKLLTENNPYEIEHLLESYNRISLQGDKLKDKLTTLQAAYEKIKASDDIELSLSYQEVIKNSIQAVSEKVGNTSIRNMTLEQLEMVYELFSMIRKTIRDANKSFKAKKGETIMQMAEAVNDQVRTVGGQPYKRNAISAAVQRVGWTFLKPFVAFRTIGSVTLTNLYKELRVGEDTFYNDVKEAQAFIEEQYKKHGYKSWDMKKTTSFTAKSGKTFDLTLEQMMTLYAYSRRDQAHKHIIEGGIVFEDAMIVEKNKAGIPIKYEVTTKDAFNLSEETFAEIANSLSAEQKAFVDEMQAYLSVTMGAKGNEVSMELLGVKLFKEEFYLPIKSSQYYRNFSAEEAGEVKLKSPAFSKETVQHANNPIVLHSFTDLWAEHINDMSMYHSFVLALEDFTRVYNYKTKTDAKVETMDTKATLETAYPGVTKYISKFLKDMNGGVRGETVGWAEKLTSLAKKGSVLGSASVAIQQPSAVMRAMAYINPMYFAATAHKSVNLMKHKQDFAELKKYAPIAGIKEMGRFDVGMGQGTVDWIKSNKTIMNKAEDVLSAAPAFMDEVTWVSIWNAVKRETVHTHKDLRPGSEEFLETAGERFTEVISLSQVYDSVFSRSDLMRNKSWIAKSLTAFMAEPSTTLNMLWDSWVQAKRVGGFKSYAKATTTTGGAIVASLVLNAALKSIVTAMRDDDEDESYVEKYLEHFFGDLKDSLNPLTLVPFVKDIVSIFKGYDVERMDMALFSDLKNAVDAFDSDSKTAYEKWSGLIGAVSAFFGIPVKNVERDIRAVINTFFGDTEATTKAGLIDAIEKGWKGESKSNSQQLYDAMVSGDTEQIERVRGRFKDQNAINSAIRKALRENDPRIKEAAQADVDGDVSEYHRIVNEILDEGYFSEENIKAAIKSEADALTEDEEDTSSEPKKQSIYEERHYYQAVSSGNLSLANEIKEDIISTDIANGKTRDEAEESFETSFRTYVGKKYKRGEANRSEATNMLINHGGYDEDKAYWKLKEWDFRKANGDDAEYSKYDSFYKAVKTGKNLKAVIKEYTDHGVSKETLASQITSYYKPLYKKMSNRERAGIKGYLLNAYALLGYDRAKKSKDIDRWLEN